ncbi:hypothetical protein VTO73DRAFT_15442 [Trametes versicolor]
MTATDVPTNDERAIEIPGRQHIIAHVTASRIQDQIQISALRVFRFESSETIVISSKTTSTFKQAQPYKFSNAALWYGRSVPSGCLNMRRRHSLSDTVVDHGIESLKGRIIIEPAFNELPRHEHMPLELQCNKVTAQYEQVRFSSGSSTTELPPTRPPTSPIISISAARTPRRDAVSLRARRLSIMAATYVALVFHIA